MFWESNNGVQAPGADAGIDHNVNRQTSDSISKTKVGEFIADGPVLQPTGQFAEAEKALWIKADFRTEVSHSHCEELCPDVNRLIIKTYFSKEKCVRLVALLLVCRFRLIVVLDWLSPDIGPDVPAEGHGFDCPCLCKIRCQGVNE